jgi:hypothetical protein
MSPRGYWYAAGHYSASDLFEHRTERPRETWRHHCQTAPGKTARRRSWHPMAARLRQSMYGIHRRAGNLWNIASASGSTTKSPLSPSLNRT